jgi:hypothetical protein
MDTVSASNTAPLQLDAQQQQLRDSLLHEVQQQVTTANQQLLAQVQQFLQQHTVVPAAPPVAAAVATAADQQGTGPAPQSSTAPAAKINPPECFSGARGQNVDDFCFNIKRYVEYNRLTPDTPQAVLCASSYLRGRASRWWRIYAEKFAPPTSVCAFCELLTKHFREANYEDHARDQLTNLRQKASLNGLRAYTDVFLDLVTALPDLREADLLYHYIKGLLPKLRAELRARKPATLEEAMNVADTLDQTWRDGFFQPSGRRWGPAQPQPSDPHCPAPMQLDALQLRGPASQPHPPPQPQPQRQYVPQQQHGDKKAPWCQLCRKRGHMADKCPLLPPGTQLPPRQQQKGHT